MKAKIIVLSAIAGLLLQHLTAQANTTSAPKTTVTHIRWTKNLPPAVRQGLRNSRYASWYVEKMEKTQDVVTIDVSQVIDYQMGGLYKDVYRLYFSLDGKLMKTEKVS